MRNLDKLRSGEEVLKFMTENLVFGPGSYEGQPWQPATWQEEFIRALYDPRRSDGSRLIDRALLLTPKGAGKTELAGALAVIELVAVESAEVIMAAASWAQVGILKTAADGCCSHPDSALAPLVEITESEIRLRNTSSRIVRVASDAGSNDGLRPTAVIRDEVHEWNTPTRERNHLVLSNGLAKRGGLQLDISTVGADRDSLLGIYDDHCRRVKAGEIVDDRLVYRYYSAEGGTFDLDTDEGLAAAIAMANPSAPEFVDVSDVARRFREVPRPEGKRYFLNLWGDGGSSQWLPDGAWPALVDPTRVIPEGSKVFAGFDGSTTSDSTALVIVAADRNPAHAVLLGCWERPKGSKESWVVPRAEVNAAVAQMFARYDVGKFNVDPFQWWEEVKTWTATYGPAVQVFKTNSTEHFGEACDRLYSAVVNQAITHDGAEVLARHIRNAVPRESSFKRTTIGKVHKASEKRIDAAVALILAHSAMGDYEPSKESVYEARGLITL